jgi:predicted PurR-regulated permease PerM
MTTPSLVEALGKDLPLSFLITVTWLAIVYVLVDRLTGLSLSNAISLIFKETKDFLQGRFNRGAVNGAMFLLISAICGGYLASQSFRDVIKAATVTRDKMLGDPGDGAFYASIVALVLMGLASLLITRTRR